MNYLPEHIFTLYKNFTQGSLGEAKQNDFKTAFILLLPPEKYWLIWHSETCINNNHVQDFLKNLQIKYCNETKLRQHVSGRHILLLTAIFFIVFPATNPSLPLGTLDVKKSFEAQGTNMLYS